MQKHSDYNSYLTKLKYSKYNNFLNQNANAGINLTVLKDLVEIDNVVKRKSH